MTKYDGREAGVIKAFKLPIGGETVNYELEYPKQDRRQAKPYHVGDEHSDEVEGISQDDIHEERIVLIKWIAVRAVALRLHDEWIEEYNAIRPHEALERLPPYQYLVEKL